MRVRSRSSTVDGTWIGASRFTQRSRPGYSPSSPSGDEDAALDQRVEQLLDEERVAAGARDDLLDELVDVVAGHEPLGEQLAARGLGQLVEHDELGAELASRA